MTWILEKKTSVKPGLKTRRVISYNHYFSHSSGDQRKRKQFSISVLFITCLLIIVMLFLANLTSYSKSSKRFESLLETVPNLLMMIGKIFAFIKRFFFPVRGKVHTSFQLIAVICLNFSNDKQTISILLTRTLSWF